MGSEPLELPTYEEVAQYQPQPGERPRLAVLIGRWCPATLLYPPFSCPRSAEFYSRMMGTLCSLGSLGAQLQELKQKLVAENPQRFGVAVPREFLGVVACGWWDSLGRVGPGLPTFTRGRCRTQSGDLRWGGGPRWALIPGLRVAGHPAELVYASVSPAAVGGLLQHQGCRNRDVAGRVLCLAPGPGQAEVGEPRWVPGCQAQLLSPFKDTTRPRRSHEKEGVEYHFVSRQVFEADLQHNRWRG